MSESSAAQSRRQYNLVTGGILQKLLMVALPIVGSQVIQMTYNLANMFFLGRVSSDAVAASGTVGMYMWLTMAFWVIGSKGAEIGVSRYLGGGDIERARRIGQTSFLMALGLGILVGGTFMLLKSPLIGFFNIREAHVVRDAEGYMSIIGMGIPFNFVTGALAGCFNGSGNARTPFLTNSVALTINIGLDALLILGLDMGIRGAAIATVTAQVCGCILLLIAMNRHRHRPFDRFRFFMKPVAEIIRQIGKWTLPIMVESFLFTFLSMLISRLIAGWGAEAIAAQRVGSQIESLSWLIAGGFSTALTAFTGQNFGARQMMRIHKGFRISSLAMTAWGVIITVSMLIFAEGLIGIFIPGDPNVIRIGAVYLRFLAVCQITACLEGVASGFFRGMGRTGSPSVISVISNGLRVVAAYVLSATALGLNGVWIAVSLGAFLRGAWMYLWYYKTHRKLPRADEPLQEATL